MLYSIRPPGKWNQVYVKMKTFTSPEALKAAKIFTDFKASMVYGVPSWTIFIFCNVWWSAAIHISSRNKCKIQMEFRCLNLNAQNQVS